MTLKTILKNFLNYADTLEAQKKLGKDIYEVDFQKLKALTEELKHDKDYATSEGLKDVNRRKNRYKDILPYDYTRVILSEYPGVPGSDFINANYIKGASGSLAYIASQGPLPNTVVDFWRMIWECEIQVIVMACNEQESGKYKCECYWPIDDEKKQYGNINVEFVKWRQVCPDFLVRTLKACWESEERVICQFHYTTWPDHGVPNSVQPILELVRLIRDCQASEAVPVLVHCSAGCGRTGTICAIDFVWGLMRMGKLTKNFNLFNVIADMRRQRIAMVQTKEQYVLVHKAVSSLFEQQLRVIDSHTYENLDEDGEPLILKELQEEDIYEDILDPPLEENYLCEDKKVEKKEMPLLTPRKESLLEYSYSRKILHSDSAVETNSNESKSASVILNNHELDAIRTDQITKDSDTDSDLSYTKNSRTLQKLRREESVKRLISGWNKTVGHSDEAVLSGKEHPHENQSSKTPPSKKHHDNFLFDQKSPPMVYSSPDPILSPKTDSLSPNESKKSSSKAKEDSLCDGSKSSSPDDVHAGKLVGKATVIRRPSIAKLKALFEKSAQANPESSDANRHRRVLFRSHSHYVTNTSRTLTVPESGEQVRDSSQTGSREECVVGREPHERNSAENARNSHFQQSNTAGVESVKSEVYDGVDAKKRTSTGFAYDGSGHTHQIHPETATFRTESGEGLYGGIQFKIPAHRKEKVPDLPVKKKHPIPPTQAVPPPEGTVPRFQVNVNRHSQLYAEVSTKSNREADTNRVRTSDMSQRNDTARSRYAGGQEYYSAEDARDYRRHSQEAEKKVLHKNQSFSDPEQSARTAEANKQALKPKSSLTDQTYPKLTYAYGKPASDERLTSYESGYTNVNSLAQKNIRQIEERLKNHPRGAIIDLTSRKSYVEETSDRNYVFRNTSQAVKVLQPQESKDLTSQERNSAGRSEAASTTAAKSDVSKAEADVLNSKNLLLHSPPPKSKRGHPSKTASKSPVSPPDSSSASQDAGQPQQTKSGGVHKPLQPANFTLVNSPPPNLNIAVATSSPAADRSDPRYFPVNRQTVSDAKYESDKQKALARERERMAQSHSGGVYESLYSGKTSLPVYQKLPVYDTFKNENYERMNQKSYPQETKYGLENTRSPIEKEPIYGLQRSTSGPQMQPAGSDSMQKTSHSAELKTRETPQSSNYDKSSSFQHSSAQQPTFPPGPPKPPRTFHYDQMTTQERVTSPESTVNRDGGRYIVTVASPKHAIPYRPAPNADYHYPDSKPSEGAPRGANVNQSHNPYGYAPQPGTEVHMSRSYPFTHYDSVYSHPRPYGKQFYPESAVYRNVQPAVHANSNIYSTIKEKPRQVQQDIYGTIKYRNKYADYENVYDAQGEYLRSVSNAHGKMEHQNQYKVTSPNAVSGAPYSHADSNVYGSVHGHPGKVHGKTAEESSAPAKRVYFDTLQRKNKQQVSWEQRRSHDDMDIRPAPSARLRGQIHARRSMVELDNLEISVASDEGEKNASEGSVSSPELLNKVSSTKNNRHHEVIYPKATGANVESKESHHKKVNSHLKEPSTFGETLSKAFGRLTSLTKFNSKDNASNNPSSTENTSNVSKGVKQKDKFPSFQTQPAESTEAPSEQWTQV